MSADSFRTPPFLEERAGSTSPRTSSVFVSPAAEMQAGGGVDSGLVARAASSSSAASSHRRTPPVPAPAPAPARSASTALPLAPHVAAGGEVATMGPVAGGVSRKTVFDRPECLITWAADFPDRLRLIKRLTLFPLRLALRADYHRPTRSFSYGCAASDAVWGGSILLDAGTRSLHYHKAVPVGGGACVGIHAAVSYGGILAGRGFSADSLRPSLSFQYELGGGAAVWTGGRIDGRHRFRVAKGLGVEVLGFAQLPAPRARYTAGSDLALPPGGGGSGGRGGASGGPRPGVITLGEGPLHLHFEEVNMVLEL